MGFCFFGGIIDIYEEPEIGVKTEEANATWDAKATHNTFTFSKEGYLFIRGERECLLFPSKNQRDWSKWECPKPKKPKFDPKTLMVFDKVLARHKQSNVWFPDFYSFCRDDNFATIGNGYYNVAIPYNDDTKHLVGTTDKAPEFYRYWEG